MSPLTPTLIDVREPIEFAAIHLELATLVPLGTLANACQPWDRRAPITLICKNGVRAEKARALLASKGFTALSVLPGGMDAWAVANPPLTDLNPPTRKPARKPWAPQPWSMDRQVRTAAGSLVLLTLVPGVFISRYFLLGTAFIGAGLVVSGVSNTCTLALLLARMPWNRTLTSAS